MTASWDSGSLGDIHGELAVIAEQLGGAAQHAALARARIADAVAVLVGLGEQHSEPLVPDELVRAADELDHGLRLISSGAMVVADIDARL